MKATQTAPEKIEITPGTCGGKPRIAGHRIRVQDIVAWYEHQGQSPDEIVSDHPTITLSDVHAALAYYYDHVQEINEDIRQDRLFVEKMRAENPSRLPKLIRRS